MRVLGYDPPALPYESHDHPPAHCGGVACTSATLTTLDSPSDVGESNSVTIGADGLGLISYVDANTGNLKVAHCGNVLCSPFVARRP